MDVWVPLERVGSGEVRLQIEAVPVDEVYNSFNLFEKKIPKKSTRYGIVISLCYHYS